MSIPTLLVSRPLPGPGAELLKQVTEAGTVKVVQWEDDSLAPREWILDNLKKGGVDGLVIMMGDKVSVECTTLASVAISTTRPAGTCEPGAGRGSGRGWLSLWRSSS